jgi:hypothetical protein
MLYYVHYKMIKGGISMEKCDCYQESYEITGWLGPYEQIRKLRKRCNGTRERDECSCGGDRTKCDFYPEVREKAKKELENIVTNADRIRAMTEDELADFFYGSPEEEFGICYYCRNFGGASDPEPCKTPHGCCEVEAKNEAFKKWLKQLANKI